MLENYNPNWLEYQKLWAKYGSSKKSQDTYPNTVISTQEQSIIASIKLRKLFNVLGQENNIEVSEIVRDFMNGTRDHLSSKTKSMLLAGLSNLIVSIKRHKEPYCLQFLPNSEDIKAAEELRNKFELFFEFDSLEDLFLPEENDENSVISDRYGISL